MQLGFMRDVGEVCVDQREQYQPRHIQKQPRCEENDPPPFEASQSRREGGGFLQLPLQTDLLLLLLLLQKDVDTLMSMSMLMR